MTGSILQAIRSTRRIPSFTAILVLLLCPVHLWAQKGHAIRGDAITTDRGTQWEAWKVAGGTVDISPDGSVGPRFMRKDINAALDAPEFATEAEGEAVGDGPGGVTAGARTTGA